jgi:protein-tyrosine phosphatase
MDLTLEEKIEQELFYHPKEPSMDEILPGLYVGNYAAALNDKLLTNNGITHILIAGFSMDPMFTDKYTYKAFNLYDSENEKISKYFEESNLFIKSGLEAGKVLVHCGAGISRSVSLIIAYLIENANLPYSEAVKFVKEKRAVAKPNDGFDKQLRSYSYDFHKKF